MRNMSTVREAIECSGSWTIKDGPKGAYPFGRKKGDCVWEGRED